MLFLKANLRNEACEKVKNFIGLIDSMYVFELSKLASKNVIFHQNQGWYSDQIGIQRVSKKIASVQFTKPQLYPARCLPDGIRKSVASNGGESLATVGNGLGSSKLWMNYST